MSVLILDTNVVGRGHCDLGALERIASAVAGTESRVVIPLPVLWEWAAHGRLQLEDVATSMRAFTSASALGVELAGLEPLSPDEAVQRLRESLPDGFEIWEPNKIDYEAAGRVLSCGGVLSVARCGQLSS